MNKAAFFLCCFFSLISLSAQILPDRYNEAIFSTWTEEEELLFSSDVPVPEPGGGFYEIITGYPLNVREYETFDQNLYMDVFQPEGDTMTKRPLVIICFGGGFLAGSKDHWSIRLLAQDLAKRGYVTATIDYRLGMNVFDADLSMRAPYRGLQDGRSAVRFFKADAAGPDLFRIDTSNIYIGGHSAGAFIALHNAYLNEESERPISTYEWVQDGNDVADQLCLDCVGDNQSFKGNAKAVFSLAGALGYTDYMTSSEDPQVVMFHSTDDGTVPYHSGQPFSTLLWLVIGSDLPDVYGSGAIAERADELALPYRFNSYTNRGHSVHENGQSDLHLDIIPGISDSFYVHFLKPIFHPIIGDSVVCSDQLQKDYSTLSLEAKYYDWSVSGGTIINNDIFSNQITVDWDATASVHVIRLTPYSIHGARGIPDSLVISMNTSAINTWTIGNGSWNEASNWSLGHSPLVCEDVVFENVAPGIQVVIDPGPEIGFRSMEIGLGVEVIQSVNASILMQTGGHLIVRGSLQLNDTLVISHPYNDNNGLFEIEGNISINENGSLKINP